MDLTVLPNILLAILDVCCLTVATRAFYVYYKSRSDSLFTLGLSMGTIALSALYGLMLQTHFAGINVNPASNWTQYVGPSLSYLFIFISALIGGGAQLSTLKSVHIVVVIVYFVFLLLTPILPPIPNYTIAALLNIMRCVACLPPFFFYMSIYMKRDTNFSLFMCLAFMLMGIGYAISTPQVLQPSLLAFSTVGSIIRIIGFGTLLAAFTTK